MDVDVDVIVAVVDLVVEISAVAAAAVITIVDAVVAITAAAAVDAAITTAAAVAVAAITAAVAVAADVTSVQVRDAGHIGKASATDTGRALMMPAGAGQAAFLSPGLRKQNPMAAAAEIKLLI